MTNTMKDEPDRGLGAWPTRPRGRRARTESQYAESHNIGGMRRDGGGPRLARVKDVQTHTRSLSFLKGNSG